MFYVSNVIDRKLNIDLFYFETHLIGFSGNTINVKNKIINFIWLHFVVAEYLIIDN